MTQIKVVTPLPFIDGIVYGEGPRWHNGRLWFSEGPAGKVYSAGEAGDLVVEAEIAHPSPWSTNDMLVAPDGRTYVDLYGTEGAIGLIGPDGSVRVVATGLAMPNGLGLLPDGTTLVVSETNGARILSFPIQADGGLGDASVFAALGAERHPDGLCVDVEGGVWVGSVNTGEFLRVVGGGAVTHRVEIDAGWSVAPALGGSDGRTLYMVIADTTAEGLAKGESTGWIMQARVDVPGAGSP
jgi:sugar lactone lactonase YvrE